MEGIGHVNSDICPDKLREPEKKYSVVTAEIQIRDVSYTDRFATHTREIFAGLVMNGHSRRENVMLTKK
jgi:hypothetical protein